MRKTIFTAIAVLSILLVAFSACRFLTLESDDTADASFTIAIPDYLHRNVLVTPPEEGTEGSGSRGAAGRAVDGAPRMVDPATETVRITVTASDMAELVQSFSFSEDGTWVDGTGSIVCDVVDIPIGLNRTFVFQLLDASSTVLCQAQMTVDIGVHASMNNTIYLTPVQSTAMSYGVDAAGSVAYGRMAYYTFQVPTEGYYEVTLTGPEDSDLYLYNGTSWLMGISNEAEAPADESIVFSGWDHSTYWLGVFGQNSGGSSSFTISVDPYVPPAPPLDTPITVNCVNGQTIMYSLTATSNTLYTFTITDPNASMSFDFINLDTSEESHHWIYNSDLTVVYILPTDESAYLYISLNTAVPSGTFDMTVTAEPAPVDDAYEENDTRATAYALPEATVADGMLILDDADWYSLSAPAAGRELHVTFDLINRLGSFWIHLSLQDGSGTQLLTRSYLDPGSDELVLALDAAGTYYLAVASGCIAEYELSWSLQDPPPDDAYEPNNTKLTAYPLAEDSLLSDDQGAGIFNTGNDDYYAITLAAPELEVHVSVEVTSYSGSSSVFFGLYGDDPNSLEGINLNYVGSGDFAMTVPAAGTYYICVQAWDSATAVYDLSYSAVTAPNDDAYEENDTRGTAFALAADTAVSAVSCIGDDDFYRMEVTGTELHIPITVSSYTGSAYSLWFDVTDASLNMVGWSWFAMPGSDEIIIPVSEDGTYYLQVGPGDGSAEYEFSWHELP